MRSNLLHLSINMKWRGWIMVTCCQFTLTIGQWNRQFYINMTNVFLLRIPGLVLLITDLHNSHLWVCTQRFCKKFVCVNGEQWITTIMIEGVFTPKDLVPELNQWGGWAHFFWVSMSSMNSRRLCAPVFSGWDQFTSWSLCCLPFHWSWLRNSPAHKLII